MAKAKNQIKTVSVAKIWSVAKQEYEKALEQKVSQANARLLFLTTMDIMFKLVDGLTADEQIYFGGWLRVEAKVRKGRAMSPPFREHSKPSNEFAKRGVIPTKLVVKLKPCGRKGRQLSKTLEDNDLKLLLCSDGD